MCSHCHNLAPTWKKIANVLSGVVKIAAVNCEDNWQLCQQVGITVYPTLLHFKQVCEENLSDLSVYLTINLKKNLIELKQSLRFLPFSRDIILKGYIT